MRLYSAMYFPLSGTPFEIPKKVRRLVCCDFDDTYLPFSDAEKPYSGIIGLEDFLDQYNDRLSVAIGWISGSSIEALLRKSNNHVRRLPHFIASSLGSEFYWVTVDGLMPSYEWSARIAESGFHLEELRRAVKEIKAAGVNLSPQHPDYQGQMIETYFYIASPAMEQEIKTMEEVCRNHRIKFVMSGCNPAAGDPAGYFDVQFMPIPCGKAEAAEFAAAVFGLGREDVWAFGDSLNDMQMLSFAGHPYLVANADPNAIASFGNVVNGRYCHGIREKLAELL
ncbi:MAG: HAD hydrolase family protein [Alistipes sp.]|nr:HAD hydrolase family protein [Alistipes sp.]